MSTIIGLVSTFRLPLHPAASTSNPPRRQRNFGLPRALSPLQCPIHHATTSFLDFLVPSRRFNVQSATPPAP